MAQTKTNAMRILDREGIKYKMYSYESNDGFIDGKSVADKLGLEHKSVYKTLLTISASRACYVMIVPVNMELDLKSAAKSVGEKKIEMLPVKDLEKTTGYVKGGCSPIGMKKQFKTVIDASAKMLDTIAVSAGKIGTQIEVSVDDLKRVVKADFAEIAI